MDKHQFVERLEAAGETARKFAAQYVRERLPPSLRYTIACHDDRRGRRGPPGTIIFLGGRFLKPGDLQRLAPERAAALLWVDGKVPAWINIGVHACDDTSTELFLRFCRHLAPADETKLPPDAGWPEGNHLVPFRIRSPVLPSDWRSVELSGRISVANNRSPRQDMACPHIQSDIHEE
jgi:hypothetical protein